MKNNNWAMVLYGKVRTTVIIAITLTIFLMAMISISNPSMFVAAKGGTSPYRYIWEKVSATSVASNPLSYGGGNISVNLPRFDREAAYFRVTAPDRSWNILRFNQGLGGLLYSTSSLLPPDIQGYQQVSCDEGTYRICVLDGSGVIPSSTSCALGFGAGCSGASGVTSGGTLSQNIVMRHGGVVQATSKYDGNTITPNVQGGQPFPVASNSMSYGGGKISVNLPRFDREASYFRHVAPYSFVLVPVEIDSPILLNDGSAYSTGNNPYGQISQTLPPSTYAVLLSGSEIYSIGDPGSMDPDNFRGTSFGGSGLQNEESLFQENLKEAIIHRAL